MKRWMSRRAALSTIFGAAVLAMPTMGGSAAAADAVTFTAEAFAAAQQSGKPILVDVAAPWCPICKRQRPLLQSILSDLRYKDVQRFDIDFDSQKDALKLVGARMQSTLIAYKGKREVGRSIGQTQREWLEDFLEKML